MKIKFILPLFAVLFAVSPVAASSDEYIYCIVREDTAGSNDDQNVYYSAVFLADYSRATRFKLDFEDYVSREYNRDKADTELCFFERDEARAHKSLERHIRKDERNGFFQQQIMTGWRPHGADNSPLQDFNIAVCNSSDMAEICVWDYACEDGDEIKVEFNRRRIFSGELFTRQYCESVSVNAGRSYPLELTALNETGGKGGCPNQVNTGAMSISSATSETQQWRHRGKTGSKIKVNVSLDDSGKCAQNQPSNAPAPDSSSDDSDSDSSFDSSSDYQDSSDYTQHQVQIISEPTISAPTRDPNLCEFANDGECDEPNFCEPGTDGDDC